MSTNRSLSIRQQHILECIRKHIQEYGYPPSVREIGKEVGISSTSVVDYNLRILEREGYIRRGEKNSRALELLDETGNRYNDRVVKLPFRGQIAAGQPIEAMQHEEILDLTRTLADDGDYILRVKGDSMIGDHISDGDLVVIHPLANPHENDIVVAEVMEGPGAEWTATLKRYRRDGAVIRLIPSNPEMDEIRVAAEQVKIQGKVVAVIRQYRY